MNPNYALRVRESLDKLLDIGFIYRIKTTQWLSPSVIVPKKYSKLHIHVDYQKLNAQTKKDLFMLPFLDSIIDSMVGHEMYGWL
jgi:predicted transcriptional regulator